jgi:hypothetical protein
MKIESVRYVALKSASHAPFHIALPNSIPSHPHISRSRRLPEVKRFLKTVSNFSSPPPLSLVSLRLVSRLYSPRICTFYTSLYSSSNISSLFASSPCVSSLFASHIHVLCFSLRLVHPHFSPFCLALQPLITSPFIIPSILYPITERARRFVYRAQGDVH